MAQQIPGAVQEIPGNYQWASVHTSGMPDGWRWGLGLVETDPSAPWGKKISDIRAFVERNENGRWHWRIYAFSHIHQGVEPSRKEAMAAAEWHAKYHKQP